MPRRLLKMACCSCVLFAAPVSAQAEEIIVQTAPVEAEATARGRSVLQGTRPGTADEGLSLSERVSFSGFDPARGRLERVTLGLDFEVVRNYSVTVDDGLPLDEEPMWVEAAGRMDLLLEIFGPDGGLVETHIIEGRTETCASEGSCTLSHVDRMPVSATFALDADEFAGLMVPALEVRLGTVQGLGAQLCPPRSGWDRCRIWHARIGIESPGDGIALNYAYDETASGAAPMAPPAKIAGMPVDRTILGVLGLGVLALVAVGGALRLRAAH